MISLLPKLINSRSSSASTPRVRETRHDLHRKITSRSIRSLLAHNEVLGIQIGAQVQRLDGSR